MRWNEGMISVIDDQCILADVKMLTKEYEYRVELSGRCEDGLFLWVV